MFQSKKDNKIKGHNQITYCNSQPCSSNKFFKIVIQITGHYRVLAQNRFYICLNQLIIKLFKHTLGFTKSFRTCRRSPQNNKNKINKSFTF